MTGERKTTSPEVQANILSDPSPTSIEYHPGIVNILNTKLLKNYTIPPHKEPEISKIQLAEISEETNKSALGKVPKILQEKSKNHRKFLKC